VPTLAHIRKSLEAKKVTELLTTLYGREQLPAQKQRLRRLSDYMKPVVSPGDHIHVFSVPGRTELGGNHTDHNHGRVLAAAVHLDSLAIAAKTINDMIELTSIGFPDTITIKLDTLEARAKERNTTAGLIRGVASGLKKHGYAVGGFKGVISGAIPVGGGLSSSASLEILFVTIFDHLYNAGKIPVVKAAQIARYAENNFFGKPCGLMDQLACAGGGIAAIDFGEPAKPRIQTIRTGFRDYGYTLAVVNTGGSHADLTPEYAAIPEEMRAVAAALGKSFCAELSPQSVVRALPALRKQVGDRALLRAFHFFTETQRVKTQARLLSAGKVGQYLDLVNESGRSSWMLLQNCYTAYDTEHQPLALALTLTRHFLKGEGACRVHGGGFAGTIQVYIPVKRFGEYTAFIQAVFGEGSVIPLQTRGRPERRLTRQIPRIHVCF
jgi:galactokinase